MRDLEPEDDRFTEEGVDRTLIRWMLSLSPLERLHVAESCIDSIRELRDAADADPD